MEAIQGMGLQAYTPERITDSEVLVYVQPLECGARLAAADAV